MGGVCRQMTAGVVKVPVLEHGGLPSVDRLCTKSYQIILAPPYMETREQPPHTCHVMSDRTS